MKPELWSLKQAALALLQALESGNMDEILSAKARMERACEGVV